ncbi:MAG: serine--tRNA ligase [Deltaproteobacteria bacterium]|nr:serine--tRNA ligase [Deltaproteobacteria bacterium]
MLDLKFVRDHPDLIEEKAVQRGLTVDMSEFKRLDEERRRLLAEVEALKHQRNQVNREITARKKAKEDASDIISEMKTVSARIKELDALVSETVAAEREFLIQVPNIPDESVPAGQSEEDNPVVKIWGEAPQFDFEPLNHWDVGVALDILDFKRAAKITGARFSLLKGPASLLERALINFMLDLHTREHGYTEVLPPFMVNSESMFGTGQLPKFADESFKIEGWDFYLAPTAEVPVTNIHRDETLDASELPICYVAYTPCFRSEAGSYGQDTRGMIRQHQFDKVELVKFCQPENSYTELEKLLSDAEAVLQGLGLPYRVVSLCTGDLGFAAAKTYDIEVWLPGQQRYREISSCSNFTDFQARRANIRYRPDSGSKTELVHTLNGSGLAVGRTMVALLENYQQADGSVVIPEALHSYTGGLTVIKKTS